MSVDLNNLNCHSFTKEKKTVFISYAWTDRNHPDHRDWVDFFVHKVELLEVNVKYDKYNAKNNQCIPFMRKSVCKSDFVICICSDEYVERCNQEDDNKKMTGAAIEGKYISKRLINAEKTDCFLIPIVKHNTRDVSNKLPDDFLSVFWLDFDKPNEECGEAFCNLGKTIFNIEDSLQQQGFDVPTIQKERKRIEGILFGLWNSIPGSDKELEWYNKWKQTTTELVLSLGKNDNQTDSSNQDHSAKGIQDEGKKDSTIWACLLGQWDDSFSGDKDILDSLGGLK